MELKKIILPFKLGKPVLALGSHTKNTVCFARGNLAYVSCLHQDLSEPGEFLRFKKTVEYLLKRKPKIIACDLHPEYQSTKYAQRLRDAGYELRPVQHHHAHIASCMLERGLKNQKVIGVAFDGTGLGTDNTIWGSEFLVSDYKNFKRMAHLREIPLLGAERAILQPWRLAAAWLYLAFKENFLNEKIVKGMNKKKWRVLKKMYLSGFNSPLSSSMGRLFDAVASLVLKKYKVNFEAELALELERLALSQSLAKTSYRFKIIKKDREYVLDPSLMFKEIVADLKDGPTKEEIASRFHLTVAQMIKKTCVILRKENKINKVVLSGGVFQNNILLCLSRDLLYQEGFNVLMPRELSCNDSAISLGQAVVANFS